MTYVLYLVPNILSDLQKVNIFLRPCVFFFKYKIRFLDYKLFETPVLDSLILIQRKPLMIY